MFQAAFEFFCIVAAAYPLCDKLPHIKRVSSAFVRFLSLFLASVLVPTFLVVRVRVTKLYKEKKKINP